jgi:hypothetical protein
MLRGELRSCRQCGELFRAWHERHLSCRIACYKKFRGLAAKGLDEEPIFIDIPDGYTSVRSHVRVYSDKGVVHIPQHARRLSHEAKEGVG